jgi:YidC/Oxa1 family membrane protein insertase
MVSSIDFSVADTTRAMCFYFGPNQYKILNNVVLDSQAEDEKELGLEELVPLGWFGIISKWIIIPLFNWLGSFISSYGIIILIMTIIIKIVIFPLTRKSYKSTASMRVLKPQIDEISKKYPKPEQAMEKQKAVMALYQRVGISPMGGCLPLLLQMPILIAMFNFFPSSIELRQQAFLWATDLSSYDSILDLPFTIPFYGNHVSLFTLLMAAAMIVSTKINSSQMDTGQSMAGMKMMMYFMPVMMVCWFNDYSSGLSYYYFLSNIITILQMWIIRKTLDEKAILAKLNSKAAKNSGKKKSGLMARLEEAQRRQMEIMKEQQKKGKRR